MLTAQYNIFAAWLKAQFRSDRGATMVEYALLVALIGVLLIGAWTFLKDEIGTTASTAGNSLNS